VFLPFPEININFFKISAKIVDLPDVQENNIGDQNHGVKN